MGKLNGYEGQKLREGVSIYEMISLAWRFFSPFLHTLDKPQWLPSLHCTRGREYVPAWSRMTQPHCLSD